MTGTKTDFPEELQSIVTQLKPNDTEVVENGKNVMRPDVMNFLLLSSIASQSVRIRKYFDDKTSIGNIQSWSVTITNKRLRINCYPAQSLSLLMTDQTPFISG